MFRTRLQCILAVLLSSVLCAGAAGDDKKKEGKEVKKPDVTGVIAVVADNGRSVTLELPPAIKGEAPGKVEIRITDKTKVAYFGVDGNGENPTIGYVAQVWLVEGSQDTAASIRMGRKDAESSKGPDLNGQIVEVSKDLKAITVELQPEQKGNQPKSIVVKLTDKTKVSYFGVDATGEIPTVGYSVLVWLAPGSKDTAAGLRLGRKQD